MPRVSATDAARNFSDILDAVEHHGEHYTIVRRGKVVAQLEPVATGRGPEVKELLQSLRLDSNLGRDIDAVRALLEIEPRG